MEQNKQSNTSGDTQFEGRFLSLQSLDGWEFASRRSGPDVVTIIPLTKNRELILTEQARIPLGARVIDLPAGLVGDQGVEQLHDAAARELSEEVGFAPNELILLLRRPTSPGLTNEMVTYYLAPNVNQIGVGGGVEGEAITVHKIPISEVDDWLLNREGEGVLIDPKVDVALRAIAKYPELI